MKILCLFVRHGTEKYPDALAVLDQWYEIHGLISQRTLWIIDNELETDAPIRAVASNTLLRPGDNRSWEFSAWARAMREADDDQERYDVVHFVTSAFNTLYTAYLGHFFPQMLAYVTSHNVCLGHIDSYDRPIELAGHSSSSWIRTCFFFLPAGLAHKIENWTAFADTRDVFSSPRAISFRHDAPLSREYQQRITVWLEGKEVGGHTWHSPVRSGQNEAARFQQKALAILNEHNFSIMLRKLHVPLVDFCWLWSTSGATGVRQVSPLPEMAQLVVRRRILGIPS